MILAGENATKSPSEAADHLLAPILTRAFAGSVLRVAPNAALASKPE